MKIPSQWLKTERNEAVMISNPLIRTYIKKKELIKAIQGMELTQQLLLISKVAKNSKMWAEMRAIKTLIKSKMKCLYIEWLRDRLKKCWDSWLANDSQGWTVVLVSQWTMMYSICSAHFTPRKEQ